MMERVLNWDAIRLVVFDVDGTLYDQRALRRRMLVDLIGHTLAARSLATVRVLRLYRALREAFSEEEFDGFGDALLERTAQAVRVDKALVQAITDEWLQRRPLAYLHGCRYPNIAELFLALREGGKRIGVFSDYPARGKLEVMGLKADFVVCATDIDIGILKPNPRGLKAIIEAAGVTQQETLMIGDRVERDGEAARRAGVTALIRSPRPIAGWSCFADYGAPLFRPLFEKKPPAT